jgi:hypothetical protein
MMKMDSRSFMISAFLGLLLFLAHLAFAPSASALLYSDWGFRPVYNDTDPPGNAGSSERDIVKTQWAYNAGYYYFLMEISGTAKKNNYYGFYFDLDRNPSTGGSPFTELPGIELYFRSGINQSNVWETKLVGNPGEDITLTRENGDKTLEWKVNADYFSSQFNWWAATSTPGTIKDYTAPVATPIPNAAWLFGTGVIALIGLRRRRSRVR